MPIRRKFGNTKVKAIFGDVSYTFDSKVELARAQMLYAMEVGGVISRLIFQPKFILHAETKPKITYKPDFAYQEHGLWIAEDVKSPITEADPRFRLKMRMWGHRGPCVLKIVMRKHGAFYLHKDIQPGTDPLPLPENLT